MSNDFKRFFALRQRLFNLIQEVDEGHHKSYEGALTVSLSFPNIYESEGNPEPAGFVEIKLGCYLLCDGRWEAFSGKTFSQCLDRFEAWLDERVRDYFQREEADDGQYD